MAWRKGKEELDGSSKVARSISSLCFPAFLSLSMFSFWPKMERSKSV